MCRPFPCLRSFFLRLYGDWLVGFSETPSSLALERTAFGLRPSFNAMGRVGVFLEARSWSSASSRLVHCLR
mgnify:CR=1 FL=1